MVQSTDRQIDALVYGLYGLTEEEIGVVERQDWRRTGCGRGYSPHLSGTMKQGNPVMDDATVSSNKELAAIAITQK